MEHQGDVLRRLGVERRDVASVHEGRRLPLDRLGDPRVGVEDHLPDGQHQVLLRIRVAVEPGVDLRGTVAHPASVVPTRWWSQGDSNP